MDINELLAAVKLVQSFGFDVVNGDAVSQRINTVRGRVNGNGDQDAQGRDISDPQFGVPRKQSGMQNVRESYATRSGENGEVVQRRKRGRQRSTVGYVVKPYRGRGRRPMPQLVPTWQRAWEAIKAARGPVTAREIEKVTGDKQKTVESSVYQLRSLGLVESQRLNAK